MSAQPEPMSKDEFAAWRNSPATQQVRKKMQIEREEIVRQICEGATLAGAECTGELTARAIGIVAGIDLFLEAEWEE